MKAKDVRELSVADLQAKETELRDLRSKYHVNPDQALKNSKAYRSARKDIARIKTILTEKSK